MLEDDPAETDGAMGVHVAEVGEGVGWGCCCVGGSCEMGGW